MLPRFHRFTQRTSAASEALHRRPRPAPSAVGRGESGRRACSARPDQPPREQGRIGTGRCRERRRVRLGDAWASASAARLSGEASHSCRLGACLFTTKVPRCSPSFTDSTPCCGRREERLKRAERACGPRTARPHPPAPTPPRTPAAREALSGRQRGARRARLDLRVQRVQAVVGEGVELSLAQLPSGGRGSAAAGSSCDGGGDGHAKPTCGGGGGGGGRAESFGQTCQPDAARGSQGMQHHHQTTHERNRARESGAVIALYGAVRYIIYISL